MTYSTNRIPSLAFITNILQFKEYKIFLDNFEKFGVRREFVLYSSTMWNGFGFTKGCCMRNDDVNYVTLA